MWFSAYSICRYHRLAMDCGCRHLVSSLRTIACYLRRCHQSCLRVRMTRHPSHPRSPDKLPPCRPSQVIQANQGAQLPHRQRAHQQRVPYQGQPRNQVPQQQPRQVPPRPHHHPRKGPAHHPLFHHALIATFPEMPPRVIVPGSANSHLYR